MIDHARERQAQKRGGRERPVSIMGLDVAAAEAPVDLLALDEAMQELAELSERQSQIVELRFFGGLTIAEVATALDMGSRSVDREWQVARAWLFDRLSDRESEPRHEH